MLKVILVCTMPQRSAFTENVACFYVTVVDQLCRRVCSALPDTDLSRFCGQLVRMLHQLEMAGTVVLVFFCVWDSK